MIPARLSVVVRVELEVLDAAEGPQLVGAAVEEAIALLREKGQIGATPAIITLLGARRTRPRRAPSARGREIGV